MNPISRTLMFAGIAVASAAVAYFANSASLPDQVDGFADVGKPFFPDFEDVTAASALAVVDYDLENRKELRFEVKREADLWVIPSHHNYPAEAADRLANTATALMGIRRMAVASRSKEDWKRFGVASPDAESDVKPEERGTRLTLSDNSGNALVDLIIGNKAPKRPNTSQQNPDQIAGDQYYVRVPEKDTTYITELNVDLSAKFSDWIEPDLLKINTADLVSITLDKYSINETLGTIDLGEVLKFQKDDSQSASTWTLADLKPETEEFDASPVTQLATNLDKLKIVGVRPKPEGLDDNMRINPVVKQILQQQMGSLGYFFAADHDGEGVRLYSNEGELLATTDKGVQYTLYFGEIARGSGKDIEVGLEESASKKASDDASDEASNNKKEDEPESKDGPRRYLLVKVDFNEDGIGPKPVAPKEPAKPEVLKSEDQADEKSDASDSEPNDASESDDAEEAVDSATPEEDEKAAAAEAKAAAEEKQAKEKTKDDAPAATTPAATTPAATKVEPSKEDVQTKDASQDAKTDGEEKAKSEDSAPAKEEVKPDPALEAQKAYITAMTAYSAANVKYQTELRAWEAKAKEGQQTVAELSERFSGWYYVISSDSYEKFRLSRKDVVSAKAAEEATSENPGDAKDSAPGDTK